MYFQINFMFFFLFTKFTKAFYLEPVAYRFSVNELLCTISPKVWDHDFINGIMTVVQVVLCRLVQLVKQWPNFIISVVVYFRIISQVQAFQDSICFISPEAGTLELKSESVSESDSENKSIAKPWSSWFRRSSQSLSDILIAEG